MNILEITDQINKNRKTVSFDSYDITVRQLYDMVIEREIDIAPEYQRHFAWNEVRQSQLIESLILGIPIPSLFMATNPDSSWEVVDGLQRLTTVINFMGDEDLIERVNPACKKLKLTGLEKLSALNGVSYPDLPKSIQLMFINRPMRVTVLNDRSDFDIRYDLFERLNTGGITLHPQEIRNCIFAGPFNDMLKDLATYPAFRAVVKTTENSARSGSYEELVLKFFAYYEDRDEFVHGVKEFLNEYMQKKINTRDDNHLKTLFTRTFDYLEENLPNGIVRGNRVNKTPLVLFEAISIGVADALEAGANINAKALQTLLNDGTLKKLTTGATNSRSKLTARINYVREAIS
ncbi:TPA: DUF262 domain-containing protein [Pseudomonas aeruginosa]|uniref:DUF262 domain-containing protein n=1 Tax=Pseudomonas aeruginosa TaxID=287 RepID=UPI0009A290D8|nr:DUF262 domain-containing protein [Pseudomonas aeruginosa]MBI7378958.1 DUF262 domain-containing protein [Pseudomonas aeruginosa]MDT1115455.1 DUF262 domain-containing protein [Pseudomonas aeruginosa]MDY1298506.1 DUF262 domain-containing protein [Pseudomonas aeruginosa]MDY1388781.1 DUF262 domain-containing protein [Pseudomonas aeruginosa]MDY1401252.1 DUF262 domain-containing protein [Pseudomonas aeruginosa]